MRFFGLRSCSYISIRFLCSDGESGPQEGTWGEISQIGWLEVSHFISLLSDFIFDCGKILFISLWIKWLDRDAFIVFVYALTLLLASITISSYPVNIYIFFSFSVQAEKREQAKKDLKGLEETVVCISMPVIVCCQYHSLAARAARAARASVSSSWTLNIWMPTFQCSTRVWTMAIVVDLLNSVPNDFYYLFLALSTKIQFQIH